MKSDSELFAVTLSRRGDTVYFDTLSGKVSLSPFDGCFQANGGEVLEYVDPFDMDTLPLPEEVPFEIISHDRVFDLMEAFA